MKKLCILLTLFFACSLLTASAPKAEAKPDNILRLHIIANSDSAEDQAVKLMVRDRILANLPENPSAAETQAYLMAHGKELLYTVESTLAEQGFSYRAQLMLGIYGFPDRAYGDTVYPAGNYNALRVVLGRGEGRNWWCVLFPPLCIVTEESEPLPETKEITFESSIGNWVRGWRDGK